MKAFIDLTSIDKGKLLHDLFPLEIPHLLASIQHSCLDYREKQEEYRKEWKTDILGFNVWYYLSNKTDDIIRKYKFGMVRSSKVFSDQLFSNHTTRFVVANIIIYADDLSLNKKFIDTVRLLYKED